jgi:single-strand DNA-binding protein
MAGINKVILIGNLGRDPEMRRLEGGTGVVNFSLATTEYYKDKEGRRIEQTEWHHIVMWRALADNAEKLLKKGYTIYVEGKLQTRKWQDKEGHQRNTTEIIADTFQLLRKSEGTAQGTGGSENSSGGQQSEHDDLPF